MFSPAHFRSFIPNPEHVHFDSQKKDERIVLLLRRHFVTNLSWILISLGLCLLPLGIPYALDLLQLDLATYFTAQQLFLLTGFYYVVVFGYAFQHFLLWYFSVGIVTTSRIVDVDFLGFLSKVVSEADLTNIQDVSISTTGVLALAFNYGDMVVQTQGTDTNVEFAQVPQPALVQKQLSELIQEAKRHAAR